MTVDTRLKLLEAVLWVGAASAALAAGSAVLGYAIGGDLIAVKYVLFAVGFLLFGAGSLLIQPESPRRDGKRFSLEDTTHQHRLEALLQRVPPLARARIPFDQRVSRNMKVFLTSLVVLGISLVMEFVLGIRV